MGVLWRPFRYDESSRPRSSYGSRLSRGSCYGGGGRSMAATATDAAESTEISTQLFVVETLWCHWSPDLLGGSEWEPSLIKRFCASCVSEICIGMMCRALRNTWS